MIKCYNNTCSEDNCTCTLKGIYFHPAMSLGKTFEENASDLDYSCEFKCAAHYAFMAEVTHYKKCYHLAIWAGEKSIAYLDKLGESYEKHKIIPQSIIVKSNYTLLRQNYSVILHSLQDYIFIKYSSRKLTDSNRKTTGSNVATNWYIHILKDTLLWLIFVTLLLLIQIPLFVWQT